MQSYIAINNRIGRAYIKAGRTEEYLNKLEKELDSANSDAELESYLKTFPRGMLFALLHDSPQFLSQGT